MSLTTETIAVRRAGADISIIDFEGDITAAAESGLLEAHAAATSARARAIVLNLSRAAYLNSSGIGLLVRLLDRTNRLNQSLHIVGLSARDRQLFRRTRLGEVCGMYDTEQEALTAAMAATLVPA